MIFLFTKSNLIGSKLIRYGLDEPSSHMAVVWGRCPNKSKEGGLVCHSQIVGGFHIDWWPAYGEKIEVVKAITPKLLGKSDRKYLTRKIIDDMWGADYDKPAFLYFTYRAFLRKYFDIPLPKHNPWSRQNDVLCTGVANAIKDVKPEWFSEKFKDGDIMTPWQMYKNMMGSGYFEEVMEV